MVFVAINPPTHTHTHTININILYLIQVHFFLANYLVTVILCKVTLASFYLVII